MPGDVRENSVKFAGGPWRQTGVRTAISTCKWPALATVSCLVVYLMTLAPTVTSEDSGELITAAHVFGIPHPPGYPLWTILCGSFIRGFAIGSVAWRANLFSAVCASLAVGILCRCLLLVGVRPAAALGASLSVGFGAVFWSQSVIAEVYTLHALMFSLLLWSVLRWYLTKRRGWLIIGCGLLGLGMCNHHMLGLSAVGLAFWVILVRPRLLTDLRLILACILVFLVCLAPYAYLLVRAKAKPVMNWGNPDNVSALVDHVNRRQYKRRSSTDSGHDKPASEYPRQARVIASYSIREQTPYLAMVGVVGLGYLALRRRHLALLCILLTAAHVALFLRLHGIGPSRQDLWASKVFFVAQYMLLAVPGAFGLHALGEGLASVCACPPMRGIGRPLVKVLPCALALTAVFPLKSHWSENNYRSYWYAYDHAASILASTLPNALIIPSGDHNTFPLIYLRHVQGVRPDVSIADKYGYIEPALYRAMPGFEGRKPRTPEERRQIEEWIIRHARRPVYYTVKKESPVPNAEMVPVGVLYHLLPDTKQLDPDEVWPKVRYRNLADALPTTDDYGADNVVADYEFFFALHLLQKNREGQALKHFARSAERGQGIKEVFNNIGCALAEYGLADEAVRYYRLACDNDDRYASARWNLARLYKSRQQWRRAEEVFLELARITPKDFRVFGELAFLGLRSGAPIEEVIHRFEESLRLNPSQPQIISELARYYSEPKGARELGLTQSDGSGRQGGDRS